MAETPFPEFDAFNIPEVQSADPELVLSRQFSDALAPAPFGVTWRINFETGDLDLDSRGHVPAFEGIPALTQWCMQTLLTERFESPLLDEDIGLEIKDRHIGFSLTPGRMNEIANQIGPALKIHDRVGQVFVDRMFTHNDSLYILLRVITDTDEELSIFVDLG